ncbi:nucleotide sugar dehydrogenase [Methylobacterium indicum]|uniref:UDP-N-acetyl-D-galactosamine dehydrogenase n=1 Tax=Methylobacterium indicum TaxID=1775910 RepID=A0A8H8WSM5_9HYPH|nr:nucleotide sugar dehydrogenase [Methylobacterium indicum]BCM83624.1 UDP-N-acetyl-D-galactosamine dehydrogenase [Methylobacterium indicum]
MLDHGRHDIAIEAGPSDGTAPTLAPARARAGAPAHGRRIAVIGLGYVGLPVAVAFAASGAPTVGFDIDAGRIAELRRGRDRCGAVDRRALREAPLRLTARPEVLRGADFFVVAVPTPIDAACRPDLGALLAASACVGAALRPGAIVVYESTVYPGATEEDCVPVLEAASGLVCGRDFTVGYSPERINPGDVVHTFEAVAKVVAGQDARTLDVVAEVYGSVVSAGVHRAPSIRVAEAAKVIENTQRDLNIALMNELAIICHRLAIDTADVLEAARTKWNFLPFTPGLVGGHCIGVDPYYLTHRAQRCDYHPEVILAGRRINDRMAEHVARECIQRLAARGIARPRVTVLGLTFKENVPDLRNSKVADLVETLRRHGCEVRVHDPLADPAAAEHEYGIALQPLDGLRDADAVVLAVAHQAYLSAGWDLVRGCLRDGTGLVLDVRSSLDRATRPEGIVLWRL